MKQAKRPPIDVRAAEVEPVKALMLAGRFLGAWELSKAIGPLDRWRGSDARTVAGRLAHFLGSSRLGSAIHILNHREHPRDPEVFLYQTFEYSSRFGALDGLALLERYLGNHPAIEPKAHSDLLAYHGLLLGYLRDFNQAHRSLDKAEALNPAGAWVHAQRAIVHTYQDRHGEALASAERGLALKPWHRASVLAAATALQNLHRDPEAIVLLEEAGERSEIATYSAQLSLFHSDNDDFARARACIETFEQRSPLADQSLRSWIAGRRSDFHYLSNRLDLAVEQARLADSPFHKAALGFMTAPDVLDKKRVRLPVSFVRQHDVTCAPATLTAVARFWGHAADHLELAGQICYDGTPGHSERNWAESSGFLVREFRLTAEVTRQLADRGIPFCLATTEATSAHLQAVIGYDDRRGTLLIRDPTHRHYRESIMEEFIEDYAHSGPRAMLMIPPAEADRLADITLPEAELYDIHHRIQRHLFAHQRQLAIPLLDDMRARFPGHRMTWTTEWSLAAYDCDARARAASVKALLDLYPKCDHFRLAHYRCLLELAPHSECLAFLRSILETREFDPVFLREYAALLAEDGRLRERAKQYYERANRRRLRDEEALTGLAGLEWSDLHFDRALRLYRFASCADVRSESEAATYFRAALRLNRAAEVLPFLVWRFDDFRTRSSAPARTLFDAHEALGKPSDGFRVLESAIESRPTDGALLLFTARSHADYGQLEQANARLEAAKPHASGIAWARTAAHVAGIENRADDAIAHWRSVLSIDPLAMDAHRGLVGILAEVESVETVIGHLRDACAEFPHHGPLAQLFVEWLRYGNHPDAEPVLLRLIDSDPNNVWARRELAVEYARQRRFEEAEAAARAALERSSSNSWSHSVLGSILMERRCFAEAMPHLREAVRLHVDNENAISSLLQCAWNHEERSEALRFVTAELQRQTSNGDAFSAFRNAAYSLVPPETLLGTLREAHAARPDLWQSASVLIDQLLDMDLFDEALAAAEALTAGFPMLAAAWFDLCEVRQRRGEFAEQIQALDHALRIRPNWSAALRRKAVAQERLGQLDEAILSATQARTVAPLAPESHGVLAKLLWQAGRRDEGIDAVERAADLSSGYSWGWETLAEWCHQTGDTPRVLAALDRLLAREEKEVRAWLIAAKVHSSLENREGQLNAAHHGLAIDPHHYELNDHKAWALAELRRYPEALAACSPEAFAGKPPNHLRARAAWIKRTTGKTDEAIAEFESIRADEPDYYWVTQQLCDLYEAKEDYGKSVTLGTQLIRLAPNSAMAHGYKAHALIELDRWDEAAACLRRALQIDPDYAFAGNHLLKHLIGKRAFIEAAEVIDAFAPYRPPDDVLLRRLMLAEAAGDAARVAEYADAFLLTGPEGKPFAASVAECVARTSHTARWGKKLAASVRDGSQRNAELGAVWMRRRLARGVFSIWFQTWKLRRLKVPSEVSNEIWDVFLRYLSDRKSARPLRWVVRANRRFLRSNEDLWGSAGYALINAQCYRSVVTWHADWRSRPNVPAWMLFNLAVIPDPSPTGAACARSSPPDFTAPIAESSCQRPVARSNNGRRIPPLGNPWSQREFPSSSSLSTSPSNSSPPDPSAAMPVLHQYRDESGHYIKACIQGAVATFQLGKAGFEELAKADIGVGAKFPLSLLIDLIREGKAFTARRAGADPSEATRFHEAEQFTFDFPEDAETERRLPVCETTGTFDDLHLVGYAGGTRAALLGPGARELLPGITVSLPLHLVTRPLLDQLVASQNLPADADALAIARQWLAQARSDIWTVHHHPPRQTNLAIPTEEELPLPALE